MLLFWDSSAVLPLLFEEGRSDAACSAWQSGNLHVAWDWMEVETHAAVVRRGFAAEHLRSWRIHIDKMSLFEMPSEAKEDIMAMNEHWGLRSADAGHIFLFLTLRRESPDIQLVTFDGEMIDLARRQGWSLWG